MATTFGVCFYLGIFADLDPVEGNFSAENAENLVGSTVGVAEAPLSENLVTMKQYNSDCVEYSMNNAEGND